MTHGTDICALALTRRLGEAIMIGEHIEVRVLTMHSGVVRIGITAPREVRIVRQELIGRPPREVSRTTERD